MTNDHETHVEDIPDHVPDQDGHISLFLMGLAIMLLVLLVIAVMQAV